MIDERGANLLVGTIVGAIISVILLAVGVNVYSGSEPGQMGNSIKGFNSLVARGRSVAQSSGNGATLYISNSGTTSTTWTLYAGRQGGGSLDATTTIGDTLDTETHPGSISYGGLTNYAVIFSSAGVAEVVAWSPGTTITSWTACPASGSWSLTDTINAQSVPLTVSCE
jgi:hypothetical protein